MVFTEQDAVICFCFTAWGGQRYACAVYKMLYSAVRICLWSHCSMGANLCKENGNSILPFRNINFWQGHCFFIPLLAEETLQNFLEGKWLCGSAPLEKVITYLYFFLSKGSQPSPSEYSDVAKNCFYSTMCGVLKLTSCFCKWLLLIFWKELLLKWTESFKRQDFVGTGFLCGWKSLFAISECQSFNTHCVLE